MKIHVWSIIKYLFIFVLIFFFVVVFKQNYLVFLLFPYVLLPAILIPVFLANVRKISLTGGSIVADTEVGNNILFFAESVYNVRYLFYIALDIRVNLSFVIAHAEAAAEIYDISFITVLVFHIK